MRLFHNAIQCCNKRIPNWSPVCDVKLNRLAFGTFQTPGLTLCRVTVRPSEASLPSFLQL